MITKIKKTGNSRAVVLPPAVWDLLKITEETPLEVTTNGVNITITPVDPQEGDFEASSKRVLEKHFNVFKALADR